MKWHEVTSLHPQTGRHKAQQERQRAKMERRWLNQSRMRTQTEQGQGYPLTHRHHEVNKMKRTQTVVGLNAEGAKQKAVL